MSDNESAQRRGATAHAYACPQCGADTSYQPGAATLRCDHCGHQEAIAASTAPVHEVDLEQALRGVRHGSAAELTAGGRQVQCKTCGARTVTSAQASRCPFCDGALVVELPADDDCLVPAAVLPFHIDRGDATVRFSQWLAERWFAPSDLAHRAQADGMDGVYLPYWTYDSETSTAYAGQRGTYYYVTVSRQVNGRQETRSERRTRWKSVRGTVEMRFNDVLVCASRSLPVSLVERLEPWDLAELRPYDGKYLAGFVAERYQVDLQSGFERAEERMEPRIRTAITADIGGDEQRISSMTVRHENVTFKHVLLPLWLSAFRYRDRVYRVSINARTGEVSGERPWSWVKIALLVVVVAALVVGVIWLRQRTT